MSNLRALVESMVILAIIAVANALFGSSDPGWLRLNPTPYLLVPILVGGRYGFAAGIVGGALAAGASLLAHQIFAGGELEEIARTAAFALLALPAIGAISGEVHRIAAARAYNAMERARVLEADLHRAEAELGVAQEAQAELQENLALHGAEFCAADTELRKLFEVDAGPLLAGTLGAIGELADVSSAAFYQIDESKAFKVEERWGDTGAFPEQLKPEAARIAARALEEGQLVTARGLWEDGAKVSHPYIAALPWKVGNETTGRVLLIADMPFLSINWANFARIETFCSWVAEMDAARSGKEIGDALDAPEFSRFVSLARETVASQGVPSTLLLFTAGASAMAGLSQEQLDRAVITHLQADDIVARFDRSDPHIAVLMPMRGGRAAAQLIHAAEQSAGGFEGGLRCQSYSIDQPEDIDNLWRRLTHA